MNPPQPLPSSAAGGSGGSKSDSRGRQTQAENELKDGYTELLKESKLLSLEVGSVLSLLKMELPGHKDAVHNLTEISRGCLGSVVGAQPTSGREVAKQLREMDAADRQAFLVEDFENLVDWAKARSPAPGPDELRDRAVRRKLVLDAVLPAALEPLTAAALAHVERRLLQRRYANDETMLSNRFEDVAPANFFVSEDNHAWDMAELTNCLALNGGVLRNPLTKVNFTEADVRAILAHPLGGRLRLQQEEQGRMRQGVRPETVTRVADVGRIMLEDQTLDMAPSRQAIDEFLAYVALLPPAEQETVRLLKIPARDSMNGREFDSTIGEAVQDAKSNVTCVHKVSAPTVRDPGSLAAP